MYLIGSLLFVLIMIFGIVCGLILPVLIGVLVYKDASKRVDCSPWLWALVAALAPVFIGLIVYLIVRKDYPLKSGGYRQNCCSGEGQEQYGEAQYAGASEASGEEGAEAQYSSYAYSQPMQEHKSMPTWGKALLIIGAVVAVILFIAMIVGVIHMFTGYFGYVNDGFGYHYDFF